MYNGYILTKEEYDKIIECTIRAHDMTREILKQFGIDNNEMNTNDELMQEADKSYKRWLADEYISDDDFIKDADIIIEKQHSAIQYLLEKIKQHES